MGTAVPAMIGRAEELERLRDCVSRLRSSGALVLLHGEAGAGKTRMVEELRPAAVGAVLEYARAPYAPIRDLLLDLNRRFPKVLERHAPLAAALAPILELRAVGAPMEEAAMQRRLLDAVAEAFGKYAALEPLVLAVEDAHWIDAASADALTHLAREARNMPMMLLVTYRSAEAAQREESRSLVAQLTRLSPLALGLRPLSETDAMLLINETATKTLALAMRRRICELAQGSPLLLLELTRHACEDPAALDTSLPVSLQAIVHDRLASFGERDREVLRICAAMERFTMHSITSIAQIDESTAMDVLLKARNAGVLAEEREHFVFRHALIRRAITDDLLAVQRVSLHARIAAHLESQAAGADATARLAYHWWMARDVERSQQYNAAAAENAFAVHAFDDAAMFFERAIDERPVDSRTLPIYKRLGESYELAGRYTQAVEKYRAANAYLWQQGPSEEAARSAISLSRACFYALDDDGSIAAVRDAIAASGSAVPLPTIFELHGLLGWSLVHLRRLEEASAALQVARGYLEHAQILPLIRYHEARAAYEVHARGGGSWREEAEQALALADELDIDERVRRYGNAMSLAVASDLDDYTFAFTLLERAKSFMKKERVPESIRLTHAISAASIQYVCGRLADARESIETVLPFVADSAISAFRTVAVGIPLALKTGDDRLLRACARPNLLQEAFASNDPVVFGPLAAAVAEHLIAQGRANEAMLLVENALKRLNGPGNNFELLLLSARIGSSAAARRAEELLAPWTERSRSARAVLALIRAHHSTGKERVTHARAAAAEFEALPWPLHQAQALVLAGDLPAACEIYGRVGAVAERARLESAQLQGARVKANLSKREYEVAELVARGYSNRVIAERLVLSERTVENHVASIFSKLNLGSRAEIAALVARESSGAV